MLEQKKKSKSEHFPIDRRLDVTELVEVWDRYVTMPELIDMGEAVATRHSRELHSVDFADEKFR